MNIRIVADSACDLPKSLVEEMNIDIMPVPITDGTTDYKDGINITPEVIYKNMEEMGRKHFIKRFSKKE